jgi:hypothetical protein
VHSVHDNLAKFGELSILASFTVRGVMRTSEIVPPFRVEPAVMPGYHPEFGYLCPSPLVRRSLRVALVSAVLGMGLGACIVLSLIDRRIGASPQNEQASTFARVDRGRSSVAQAATFEIEPAATPIAREDKAGTTISSDSCEDEAASYLDSKCHLARRHREHTSQSRTSRLATVEIGRIRDIGDIERPVSNAMNGRSTQAEIGQISTADGPPVPSMAVFDQVTASATKPGTCELAGSLAIQRVTAGRRSLTRPLLPKTIGQGTRIAAVDSSSKTIGAGDGGRVAVGCV